MRSATTRPARSPSRPRSPVTSCSRTLHTNDAPSAVTRLTEMGIEPFLVGSALDCVLAQRLARRLCPKCKEAYTPDPRSCWSQCRFPWQAGEPLPELYRPVGCSACSKTGYKGRLALHEVMAVSEEIERLAVERASATEIGTVAREQGMTTLRDDGLAKVLAGRHLDRGDPARRRLKAWQGRPSRSSAAARPADPPRDRCTAADAGADTRGVSRWRRPDTSRCPNEPGGFAAMPVPAPEPEAPADRAGPTPSWPSPQRPSRRLTPVRRRLRRPRAPAEPFEAPAGYAAGVAPRAGARGAGRGRPRGPGGRRRAGAGPTPRPSARARARDRRYDPRRRPSHAAAAPPPFRPSSSRRRGAPMARRRTSVLIAESEAEERPYRADVDRGRGRRERHQPQRPAHARPGHRRVRPAPHRRAPARRSGSTAS